jgi:hypothetical protein
MLNFMVVNDKSSVALHFLALAVRDNMIMACDIFISGQIQTDIRELPFYCRHLGFPAERYVQHGHH